MSDAQSNDNIMGFIPKEKYVLYTYYLILGSSVLGLVTYLFSLIGVVLPLGGINGLIGLAALLMGLIGYFGFKESFGAVDQSHLLYICALFGIFFVAGLILGAALVAIPLLFSLVMILFGTAQLALFFTGYNSHKHGRTVTKDNVKEELQLALKRA